MKIIAITPNKKQDYLTETIVEGFKKLNTKIFASDTGNGILESYNDEIIIEESKNADYIIAFFGKIRDNKPPKHYLLDKIDRWDRTAFIDGSEWTCSGYPNQNQLYQAQILKDESSRRGEPWLDTRFFNKAAWYFKRECYKEDIDMGVHPLLFGFVDRMRCEELGQKKDIDIFCGFGQDKDGLRKEAKDACFSLQKDFNVVISSKLSYEEYKKTLSRSLMSIDAWGGGDCCARIWEIMGNGVCCFYQKYNISFPDMPEEDKHAVSYRTKEELRDKLNYFLYKKDEALKIGEEGKKFIENFHSSKARVEKMLQTMETK